MKPSTTENIMDLLPTYAQKQTNKDVWIINDKGKRIAIYPPDHPRKPTRRNKYLMLNCYRWKLIWLPNAK